MKLIAELQIIILGKMFDEVKKMRHDNVKQKYFTIMSMR